MKALMLSPKQSLFVQAIVKGATYADAYKKAGFEVPKGDRGNAVARSNAWRLLETNENVQSEIKLLRQELRNRAQLEASDLVEMLRECRAVALAANPPQASAAVAAVMGIAKLLGLQVDRAEISVQHKPAPLPTALVELSQADWERQFDPGHKPRLVEDFLE